LPELSSARQATGIIVRMSEPSAVPAADDEYADELADGHTARTEANSRLSR
jgi:hypothetical protein